MTAKPPAKLADDAYEALRALNHATLSTKGAADWEFPGDAYSVVGNLSQAAMVLPQALEQTEALVKHLEASGNLRSDRNTLDTDLAATYHGLAEAQAAAQTLFEALNRAHSGLSPIAYKD
ncbi:hypothetical protein ABT391_37315 [Streptomyces jumonjinensis]|uniref:hypothetical protein n=1 Tax=Streptomyces jumonjinensis TaxID=1945 RepID=UPI00331B942E